ncbi:MAG: M48 family metalloprotease [Candidatus Sericytochromatia bacterium]|nr:M48 family metalloprotease [Candidatus Sericytochromatia bacterium]
MTEDFVVNQLKTLSLLVLLSGLLVVAGRALGGSQGAAWATLLAVALNLGGWWFSDRLVLATSSAVPLSPEEAPGVHDLLAQLAAREGMPMPAVYLIPEDAPNAFATGRDPAHAVVAVTEGLLRTLPPDALRGVLAHELAHIRNRDTLAMALAASLAAAIGFLADMARWGALLGGGRGDEDQPSPWAGLLLALLLPFAALLVRMAVSRTREFEADASAARMTGQPLALADALARLEREAVRSPMAHVSPSSAHLYIVDPLRAGAWFENLFRTHPPMDERIRRLERLATP